MYCPVSWKLILTSQIRDWRLERMYVNNTYGVFLLSLTSPCFLRTPPGDVQGKKSVK
jgi:hypothetical protein